MKTHFKLGTKLMFLTLVLSLVPILVVTILNVRNSATSCARSVDQDFGNMVGFVWEVLDAREELVKKAEIGDELVLILQAREQEKNFVIKEDQESIKNWRAAMDQIKKSSAYVGESAREACSSMKRCSTSLSRACSPTWANWPGKDRLLRHKYASG